MLELLSISTAAAAKSLQSCPTLCDPMDGSPPGSPVPGVLQARTLAIDCSEPVNLLNQRHNTVFQAMTDLVGLPSKICKREF